MGVEGVCRDGQGPPPFPSAPWVGDSVPRRGRLCAVHLERDDAWASRLLAWVQFAQPTFRIVVSGQKLERCFVFICTELEHSPATSHVTPYRPSHQSCSVIAFGSYRRTFTQGDIQATCLQSLS